MQRPTCAVQVLRLTLELYRRLRGEKRDGTLKTRPFKINCFRKLSRLCPFWVPRSSRQNSYNLLQLISLFIQGLIQSASARNGKGQDNLNYRGQLKILVLKVHVACSLLSHDWTEMDPQMFPTLRKNRFHMLNCLHFTTSDNLSVRLLSALSTRRSLSLFIESFKASKLCRI